MRRLARASLIVLATAVAAPVHADVPVSLRGSLSAMERQHGVALELGYAFVRTPGELAVLEEEGELVRLEGNDDYGLARVGSMLARPEMRTFIERLSAEYRAACDERLVVTSLTRPLTRQPRNAHRLSVHPAGIAVDLRVSDRVTCRSWLEERLLGMEEAGLLDVTRERYPPHYHVALFPVAYTAHIAPILAAERARAARAEAARLAMGPPPRLVAGPVETKEGGRWSVLGLAPFALVGMLVARRRGWTGVEARRRAD